MIAFYIKPEQRHHEARRAESALRAMTRHHRLLCRMQRAVGLLEALNGEQRLAVKEWNELQARVDRSRTHRVAVELSDDDGTRTTIAFCAAFLGAGATKIFANVVQHRFGRRDAADRMRRAVEQETDGLACSSGVARGVTVRAGSGRLRAHHAVWLSSKSRMPSRLGRGMSIFPLA